jgi:uncharacterized protein with von Willebrand factor type A (vWA) domain
LRLGAKNKRVNTKRNGNSKTLTKWKPQRDIKFIEDIVVATFSFSKSDTPHENILKATQASFLKRLCWRRYYKQLKVLNQPELKQDIRRQLVL